MKIILKQCKQCGEVYKPFNTLQVVCSAICALEFNSKKEVDKRFKVMKSDSRSLIELRNLARVSFQIYIRQREKIYHVLAVISPMLNGMLGII